MTAKAILDLEVFRSLIEVQKLQQRKIAKLLGVSVSCVERTAKRLGLRTERTGPRAGPGHPRWKGGRILIGRYWHLWMPDHPHATTRGYFAEHRDVVEREIGRRLELTEVVHHIDGNPQNNDPENLMVFQTNAKHLKAELTGRVPNWTPGGKARIREGNLRRHTLHPSKRDGLGRIQKTALPPEKS